MKKTVVVGMSGGVDSSVSALLLKGMGYNVVGVFMKNWEDEEGCSAGEDFRDVVDVCNHIGIPYYSMNLCEEYQRYVFSKFLDGYKRGMTPNPDILCNREIKFKEFLSRALDIGDYVATGHYCRNCVDEDGRRMLFKGVDLGKDQSYFLYTLDEEILERVIFPIGGKTKREVREIAKEANLVTAAKKDSVGICFIGKKRKFADFLQGYIEKRVGNIEDIDGNVVGKHCGVYYYTVGQRSGLGIGGAGEAWFVAAKDVGKNVIVAVQGEHHDALYAWELTATDLCWVWGEYPGDGRLWAKIRYRQDCQGCVVEKIDEKRVRVVFEKPQRAIALMQSVVFYRGEQCLGGGVIESVGSSVYDIKKRGGYE